MSVLGVSCYYHDSAAALVSDGVVVAAIEEERFSRKKHDRSLPAGAIESCLAMANIGPDDLEAVVVHEKPLVVASRILAARQRRRGRAALSSFAREFPVIVRENLLIGYRIEQLLRSLGARRPPTIRYSEHHLSHAAAAFLPSPFENAAIMTVDGIGEWSTATIGKGEGRQLELLQEQRFPHSMGLLYSLVTAWCGFEPNDGEYKLMGLAPFGYPSFADALEHLVTVDERGALDVDADMVRWWSADLGTMTGVAELFGGPPRAAGAPLTQREADLARSVQELTELVVVRMARHAKDLTGAHNLCVGGGVALNCVANGRLLREGIFDEVWVQPSPGDAGSALGAALWYAHGELGGPRAVADPVIGEPRDAMRGAALGPRFAPDEVRGWLESIGQPTTLVSDPDARAADVAQRLADGAIVGWFEGPMEFGPRALGHRSILADPRSTSVHRELNIRVKGRESFRPFAPSVMAEHASEWFDMDRPSPFMLFTYPVTSARLCEVDEEPESLAERARVPRSEIPACTHVDGSARVQTVHGHLNPEFHRLLSAFLDLTGCPVLLNTSFNRAGEPIVCTPEDALRTARDAGLDALVIEDHIIDLTGPSAEPQGGGLDTPAKRADAGS